MPDGRTRVEREVEGGFVTIYFSEKDDGDTLEKVKSMIMDAYAERKHREGTVQQIRSYYDEFLGWANEFDLATVQRKRAILAQLFEKVEVGKGYRITIHVRGTYKQFLGEEPHE